MEEIKKIISEEIKEILKEQIEINEEMNSQQQKQTAIKNINQHLKLLKLLKSTVKQIKMPEQFIKMSDHLKQSQTAAFLNQFLGVKDDIPIKIEAVLTNPLETIQAVIDEVINNAYKSAKQKLQEVVKKEDLPHLFRTSDDYKIKHDSKLKKKGLKKAPPPIINPRANEPTDVNESGNSHNLIQKLEKKARKWSDLALNSSGEEKQKAEHMAKTFSDKAIQLKDKFGIKEPQYSIEDEI